MFFRSLLFDCEQLLDLLDYVFFFEFNWELRCVLSSAAFSLKSSVELLPLLRDLLTMSSIFFHFRFSNINFTEFKMMCHSIQHPSVVFYFLT